MKILVTGGSGLLGAGLTRLLSREGHVVISTYRTNLPPVGNASRLDLTEPDTIQPLILKVRPGVIIHTAAVSDVDLCEEAPDMADRVNGEATGRIGQAAMQLGAYVIYISTDYVFNGRAGNYREEDKPNPVNHYGMSKLTGEKLLKESGTIYCIARTSVVYGWNRQHRPNFATWALSKLQSRQRLRVVEDQFASPTLNSNLAEMVIELTDRRLEGIIHLAGATRIDRYNFAKQIAETFHCDPNLIEPSNSNQTGWRAKRPHDSSLNVERAETLFDRKPMKLPDALERFSASRIQSNMAFRN